jgi:AcrR family transcriptional regulator
MAVTLREQSKTDKLNRIRQAARHLFSTKGFDNTSTREIAEQARVGLATLFIYATDKRDLLFLACNDDLELLTRKAFAKVDLSKPLIDQFLGVFRHFYVFYSQNRTLSQDLLRELTFYSSGQQSERFHEIRSATIGHIEHLILEARKKGGIRQSASDATIAEAVFYLFAAKVRHWLAGKETSVERGLAQLRTLLVLLIEGLSPEAKKG